MQRAGSSRSGFQAFRAIGFLQAQDAQTTTETLFRMRSGFKDRIDQRGREGANRRCPTHQTLGCPFQVALMRFGPMRIDGGVAASFVTAGVTGDALPAMKDLDGHRRVARVEFTVKQRMRNAVVMALDFDVAIWTRTFFHCANE